jgi:hypothetical protein
LLPIKLPHTITNMKDKINMESTIVGSIVAWIENKQRLIHTYLHLIYCNNIMFEWKGTQLSKLKRCHQLSKLKRCHQLRILHVSHCYIYIRFINLKPFLLSFYQTLLYILPEKLDYSYHFYWIVSVLWKECIIQFKKNIMYIKGIQSLRLIFFYIESCQYSMFYTNCSWNFS